MTALEPLVFQSCDQRADVEFPVLSAEHGFVPWADLCKGCAAPDGTGCLPRDVHLEKTIQIVLVGLAIPKQLDVAGGIAEKLAGEKGEAEIRAVLHHIDALLQAMGREQVVGIEEDHEITARFGDAEIAGGGSAGV